MKEKPEAYSPKIAKILPWLNDLNYSYLGVYNNEHFLNNLFTSLKDKKGFNYGIYFQDSPKALLKICYLRGGKIITNFYSLEESFMHSINREGIEKFLKEELAQIQKILKPGESLKPFTRNDIPNLELRSSIEDSDLYHDVDSTSFLELAKKNIADNGPVRYFFTPSSRNPGGYSLVVISRTKEGIKSDRFSIKIENDKLSIKETLPTKEKINVEASTLEELFEKVKPVIGSFMKIDSTKQFEPFRRNETDALEKIGEFIRASVLNSGYLFAAEKLEKPNLHVESYKGKGDWIILSHEYRLAPQGYPGWANALIYLRKKDYDKIATSGYTKKDIEEVPLYICPTGLAKDQHFITQSESKLAIASLQKRGIFPLGRDFITSLTKFIPGESVLDSLAQLGEGFETFKELGYQQPPVKWLDYAVVEDINLQNNTITLASKTDANYKVSLPYDKLMELGKTKVHDLLLMSSLPNQDQLDSLLTKSHATYVRVKTSNSDVNTLFYINKDNKPSVIELDVPKLKLREFDEKLGPTPKERTLTRRQLSQITSLTGSQNRKDPKTILTPEDVTKIELGGPKPTSNTPSKS